MTVVERVVVEGAEGPAGTMGPLARELWDRAFLIADPGTKWVNRTPILGNGEVCLIAGPGWGSGPGRGLSPGACTILTDLMSAEGFPTHITWNDALGRTREEVVWLLEEAAELAEDLGL